jgi:manganese/zinc/iron transport system ATP- binding protein
MPQLSPHPPQHPAPDAHPLSVSNLTVSYNGSPVLRAISFHLQPGQLTAVVGPNGAGKSTLLKAILGLIPLSTGRIESFGSPVASQRHRIAYVPQTEAVDWDFPVTAQEVVLMGRYGRLGWFGRPRAADRQKALDALAMVDMVDFRHRHIRQLSGGQQQRIFLARALCQEADVLLLDEPLGGVDAATENAIFALIDRLTAHGKTLLVVNHDLSILNRFDRVLLLNRRLIAFGPTQQVMTDDNLRATYGGRLSLLEKADANLRQQGHDTVKEPGQ